MSPNRRAWARFKRNRLGTVSLWAFIAMLVVSALAEFVSNDRPLLVRFEGAEDIAFDNADDGPIAESFNGFQTTFDRLAVAAPRLAAARVVSTQAG